MTLKAENPKDKVSPSGLKKLRGNGESSCVLALKATGRPRVIAFQSDSLTGLARRSYDNTLVSATPVKKRLVDQWSRDRPK